MKTLKRNAIILSVLLFVCVAVYLNWQYNKKGDDAAAIGDTAETETLAKGAAQDGTAEPETATDDKDKAENAGLYYTAQEGEATISEYFATVRLNRSKARDSAVETLSTVSETEGASQETIDEALAEISQVAAYTVKEAELEGLLLAKGFEDCVVFINDGGIDVTVPAPSEGLSTAAVARITDVVTSETEFKAENLKVIEVKG